MMSVHADLRGRGFSPATRAACVVLLAAWVSLAGCSSAIVAADKPPAAAHAPRAAPAETNPVVYAVNVGGPSYQTVAGVRFNADEHVVAGAVAHTQALIRGTPDRVLYQTNRSGPRVEMAVPLPDGNYQVTLHLAEINGSTSKFDVHVEGQLRYADVDVIRGRDGRREGNYDVTLDGVRVSDGKLDLALLGKDGGQATLSALSVRRLKTPDAGWRLVWNDEFDRDGPIDSTKWNIENWAPKTVNQELQRYTGRLENVRVENGNLVIEARRDFYMGDEYSSARVTSARKGDLLYGRAEIRAKLPDGVGTWPAIWMYPTDQFRYATTCSAETGWKAGCDAWPASGEIDIMEHVGFDPGQVWATVHHLAGYWVNFEQRKGAVWKPEVTRDFHVYAMEWTPERIDIFIDDTLFFSYLNDHQGFRTWPYDHPFHVILNVAVGGGWGGVRGVAKDIWPKQMLVDYVRLYQRPDAVTATPR
jgi:beta-glucanase (GH16 family)